MNKRGGTALERSQQVQAGKSVDWRRLASAVLATLGAIAVLLGAYQLFAQWQYDSGKAHNQSQARRAAAEVRAMLDAQADRVTRLAASPHVLEGVRGDDARRQAIQQQMVDEAGLMRALLLDPRVELIVPEPFPGPNYSAIAVALIAKNTREVAGPIISGQGGAARLTWGAPIESDGALAGELVASFPLEPLADKLGRPDGYLDVRVIKDRGSPDIVAHRGQTAQGMLETLDSFDASRNISIGYGYDQPFGLLIPSLVGAALVVLLGTLLGILAYWVRFQPNWQFLRRGGAEEDEDARLPAEELVDDELREAMAFAEKRCSGSSRLPTGDSKVDPSIFRTYDIRGIVGYKLDAGVAKLIGQAIGSEATERDVRQVVVARDGRLSGPDMAAALIEGLRGAGIDVIDIGAVPTGVLYFATHHLETGSGVMVTGSHNPPEYNGFKVVLAGETLFGDGIRDLHRRIVEGDLEFGAGGVQEMDLLAEYVDRIASDIQVEEPLKVVVDCGNGIPGMAAPQVLEEIGCEVVPLYCEVDGNFPNHHPDPSVLENLKDLITSVQRLEADLGIAMDGDGDRLGVVTRAGQVIYPDRLLMLFAEDVLLRNPGATIIYDVKCTGHLAKVILRHGGSPLMWTTGHSLIKAKMKETDAALAGEMSGHFFFKERWYGFDDGIYAAARLLEILAAAPEGVDAMLAALPDSVSTPEIKIEMEEGEHFDFMERFQENADFEGARITTIDGVRADFDDGWGLVRCSNTTPSLVLRFDAESQEALKRIQLEFKRRMIRTQKDLQIPF